MGLLLFLEDATLDNGWSAPSSTTPCRPDVRGDVRVELSAAHQALC